MSGPAHLVVLLRHGETEWSRALRHTGRSDVPLTDDGRAEARAAGARLAGLQVGDVFTSPLQRAVETCKLAGFGADAQRTDALLEWDYGAYEGRTSVEIRAERPAWSLWHDGCPGGERAADVAARVAPLVAACAAAPGTRLLVAHGHVLRVFAARWCGLPPEAGALLQLGTGAVSLLGFEHGVPGLRRWNVSGELR